MKFIVRLVPHACLLALAGCGSSSLSLEEQLQHVASTASSATLFVQAWCDGNVPRDYAMRTVDRAGENLDRISGAVASMPASAGGVQEAMTEIERLEAAIATARVALEREDKIAARSSLDLLRQLESEARRQTLVEAGS